MVPPLTIQAKQKARGSPAVWLCVNAAIKKVKKKARARNYSRTDVYKAKRKRTWEKHKDRYKEMCREWQRNNPSYYKDYKRNKYATDENFKVACNARSRILSGIKAAGSRRDSTSFGPNGLVGCTKEAYVAHLKTTLPEGTELKNAEIDHIWPVVLYNLNDPVQQRNAFHWSNSRATTVDTNREKGGRIPARDVALLVPRERWPPGFEDYA